MKPVMLMQYRSMITREPKTSHPPLLVWRGDPYEDGGHVKINGAAAALFCQRFGEPLVRRRLGHDLELLDRFSRRVIISIYWEL
jgi:hypothetical protein